MLTYMYIICACVHMCINSKNSICKEMGHECILATNAFFIIDWSITYLFWLIENCLVYELLEKKNSNVVLSHQQKLTHFTKYETEKQQKSSYWRS